jgi:hypothetical protein
VDEHADSPQISKAGHCDPLPRSAHPTVLRNLFQKLSLKNDRTILTKIAKEVDRTNPEYVHHMTATQPQESTCRWKTQLDAEVAAAFSFFFKDELKAFGYEVETAAKPPTEDVWRRELGYGNVNESSVITVSFAR